MSCTTPLQAWKPYSSEASKSLYFGKNAPVGEPCKEIKINCRQCLGCRKAYTIEWSSRMMHEASLFENNQFITLTYDEENLPINLSLVYRDYQLFMKRLRKRFGSKIRFVMCGEYGELNKRPHYHGILFNLELQDLELFSNKQDNKLYTSEALKKIWGKGFVTIGAVNLTTCKYVASYMLKELNTKDWANKYDLIDSETGEIIEREKPFKHSSNRPGIGKAWFDKYQSDVFPSDFVIINGKKIPSPNYYFRLLEKLDEIEHAKIKLIREKNMQTKQFKENTTPERLETRTKIAEINQKRYKRDKDEQ